MSKAMTCFTALLDKVVSIYGKGTVYLPSASCMRYWP